jgi:hypothetical protein
MIVPKQTVYCQGDSVKTTLNFCATDARVSRPKRHSLAGNWLQRVGHAAWACAILLSSAAHSQSGYPTKPIRIIVPFGAGSGLDVTARGLAQQMTTQMGVGVIVENREGASGVVGTTAAKSAANSTV